MVLGSANAGTNDCAVTAGLRGGVGGLEAAIAAAVVAAAVFARWGDAVMYEPPPTPPPRKPLRKPPIIDSPPPPLPPPPSSVSADVEDGTCEAVAAIAASGFSSMGDADAVRANLLPAGGESEYGLRRPSLPSPPPPLPHAPPRSPWPPLLLTPPVPPAPDERG